jgi:hypothetical protein
VDGVYDWNGVGTKCPREKIPLVIFAIHGKINVSGLGRSVITACGEHTELVKKRKTGCRGAVGGIPIHCN